MQFYRPEALKTKNAASETAGQVFILGLMTPTSLV
jgi:hypothetical protein